MVQEKLQDIDLDLPPSTQPESAASRPEA
jgi:hypothetical protein